MVAVLSDPSLYEFTGGTPPTLEELTARYARQAVGHSPDGTEQWLNWVVLLDSAPVGYVQATVVGDSRGDRLGDLARRSRAAGWPPRPPAAMVELLSRRRRTSGSSRTSTPTTRPRRGSPSGSACGVPTWSRTARSAGSATSMPTGRRGATPGRSGSGTRTGGCRSRRSTGSPPHRSASTTPPASGRATTAAPPSRSAPGEALGRRERRHPGRRGARVRAARRHRADGWPSATPSSRWPSATAA